MPQALSLHSTGRATGTMSVHICHRCCGSAPLSLLGDRNFCATVLGQFTCFSDEILLHLQASMCSVCSHDGGSRALVPVSHAEVLCSPSSACSPLRIAASLILRNLIQRKMNISKFKLIPLTLGLSWIWGTIFQNWKDRPEAVYLMNGVENPRLFPSLKKLSCLEYCISRVSNYLLAQHSRKVSFSLLQKAFLFTEDSWGSQVIFLPLTNSQPL